jgi:osmoprotectant transport system permease protein
MILAIVMIGHANFLLFACIIGIPIGIVIARYKKLAWPIITIANIIQTVPAMPLPASLIFSSTSTMPVYVFLIIGNNEYKNTVTNIKDAGKGMGMTRNQVLRMIELPLSLSVIIGGIRYKNTVTTTVVGPSPIANIKMANMAMAGTV